VGDVIPMAGRKRARAKSQTSIIFGRRLKNTRELAGYKYAKEFAPLVGKKVGAYNKYERGESDPPLETLSRICTVLDVTPTFLLWGPVPEKADLAGAKRPRKPNNSP
jgi:transcriptional regulator with XRE-family HTH domain